MRILLKVVLAVLVLAVVALAGAYFYLQQSLPKEEGETRLGGLEKPVEVLRDAYAIPHIRASPTDGTGNAREQAGRDSEIAADPDACP